MFGGLVKLRQDLGFEIHNYGIGQSRASLGKIISSRGTEAEREIEEILIRHFGEHFVHIEKPLHKYYSGINNKVQDNKFRADFFVYAAGDIQFCVDVFYPSNLHNLRGVIHHKVPNYTGLKINTYLVNMNESISPATIKSMLNNKVKKIDGKIIVINKSYFLEYIKTLRPLSLSIHELS